jgi:hypothetical protein
VPGGIQGVTSKSKETSIKLYNGMDKYNQWAFIAVAASAQLGGSNGTMRPGQGGFGGMPTPGNPFQGGPGRFGQPGAPNDGRFQSTQPGGFGQPGQMGQPSRPPVPNGPFQPAQPGGGARRPGM